MSQTELTDNIETKRRTAELKVEGTSLSIKQLRNRKVWIDLENSPHIPFFAPIIKELEARGCEVVLTARDCFQVCELADMAGFRYRTIGHHYGKHMLAKAAGLGIRVAQMAPYIMKQKPAIAVCHGSRSMLVLAHALGIPSVNMLDYEHADHRVTNWLGASSKKWMLTPEVIPTSVLEGHGIPREHILKYPGIKEDVYTPFFKPDPTLKETLELGANEIIVTIRPPATEAHYHNPESEKLLSTALELLGAHADVKTVLLPRTHKQGEELREAMPDLFASGRVLVPKHAVDGLDLIWYSDLVISGGGTMNREAAALGIPVYSLFRGTMGAVDKHLAETGRLVLLESERDVREKMKIVRRDRTIDGTTRQRTTLETVVNQICMVMSRPS